MNQFEQSPVDLWSTHVDHLTRGVVDTVERGPKSRRALGVVAARRVKLECRVSNRQDAHRCERRPFGYASLRARRGI